MRHTSSLVVLAVVACFSAGCQSGSGDGTQVVDAQTEQVRGDSESRDSSRAYDFTGKYSYTGTNPDRSEYVGQYTILIERKGDTYDYQWIQNDQVTDHGIGIASGDTLSVAFDMNGTPGLSVLTPDGPNRLRALWSVVGSETIGTETLTKIP